MPVACEALRVACAAASIRSRRCSMVTGRPASVARQASSTAAYSHARADSMAVCASATACCTAPSSVSFVCEVFGVFDLASFTNSSSAWRAVPSAMMPMGAASAPRMGKR